MVSKYADKLVLLFALALVTVCGAFASGISSAGVSLAAANTWSAAQTFANGTLKLGDSNNSHVFTIVPTANITNDAQITIASTGDDVLHSDNRQNITRRFVCAVLPTLTRLFCQ